MTAHYDFDAMQLNTQACMDALTDHPHHLTAAFIWSATPQGEDYWSKQMSGLDADAKCTLQFLIDQDQEFKLADASLKAAQK